MDRFIIKYMVPLVLGIILCFLYYKIHMYKYKKEREKQRTHVYCPKCRNELIANGNLIKDTDFVYYKCSKCGHESKWDFDTPCPILIEGGDK